MPLRRVALGGIRYQCGIYGLGIERRTVMECNALSELKRDGFPVFGGIPAQGQPWFVFAVQPRR